VPAATVGLTAPRPVHSMVTVSPPAATRSGLRESDAVASENDTLTRSRLVDGEHAGLRGGDHQLLGQGLQVVTLYGHLILRIDRNIVWDLDVDLA
jgi:hypothetical protein